MTEKQVKEDEHNIALIMDWASEHPEFDTEFVERLSEQLDKRGYLTEKQSAALENIIERFGIE